MTRETIMALIICAALGGAFVGGMHYERADWKARWALRDADDAAARSKQEKENRATEHARQQKNEEIQAHATQQIDQARADVDAGRADAERLRKQVAVLTARRCAPSNPGASVGSAPSKGANLVLTDVFGWSDGRASELAEAYDRARIAGLACEAAYESIRNQQ